MQVVRDTATARDVVAAQHDELPRMPHRTPFMVVGTVNGDHEATGVGTPGEALDLMVEWLQRDDEARAVWYLREDWPEPITVIGRLAESVAGESSRSTHLFPIERGTVYCGSLVTQCGTELALPHLEWLRLGAGMPCEHCLARTKTPHAPLSPPRPHGRRTEPS